MIQRVSNGEMPQVQVSGDKENLDLRFDHPLNGESSLSTELGEAVAGSIQYFIGLQNTEQICCAIETAIRSLLQELLCRDELLYDDVNRVYIMEIK